MSFIYYYYYYHYSILLPPNNLLVCNLLINLLSLTLKISTHCIQAFFSSITTSNFFSRQFDRNETKYWNHVSIKFFLFILKENIETKLAWLCLSLFILYSLFFFSLLSLFLIIVIYILSHAYPLNIIQEHMLLWLS